MPGAAQPGQAQHPNLTLLQPPKTFCSHLIFPPKKIGISLLWSSPSSLQPAPGISSGNLRAPIAAHTNCSGALLCSAPLPLQQNMDFPVKYPNSSCSGPLRSSSGRITNVEQGIWFFFIFPLLNSFFSSSWGHKILSLKQQEKMVWAKKHQDLVGNSHQNIINGIIVGNR